MNILDTEIETLNNKLSGNIALMTTVLYCMERELRAAGTQSSPELILAILSTNMEQNMRCLCQLRDYFDETQNEIQKIIEDANRQVSRRTA